MKFVINFGTFTQNTPRDLGQYMKNPPEVLAIDQDVYISAIDRRLPSGARVRVLRFFLAPQTFLECLEWPEEVPSPPRVSHDGVRHIRIQGRTIPMPRKMWSYGRAYPFSGQTVPREAETPKEVSNLLEVSSELFRGSHPYNMCLVNDYGSGREAISEHSDDEAMAPGGKIEDVVCWIDGPAKRLLIIRDAVTHEVVLKLNLGRCVYAMRGTEFQTLFTHEVPEQHPALYKKMCGLAAQQEDFPESTIDKSRWLVGAEDFLRPLLSDKDYQKYLEWRLHRISYTIRAFA